MNTVFTASTLRYTQQQEANWMANAFQGAYGSGKPRVGAMLFPTLRGTIDWTDMVVSEIVLALNFGLAGANRRKTLGLYATSRNSIGGTGKAMLGEAIGQIYTEGNAFNRREEIYFNDETNAAAFAQLKQWIEFGETHGLAVYLNETALVDASANYCNITAAELQITYDHKGSKGTVEPESADVGETVRLVIDPLVSEYVVSHTVQWICGETESEIETLAGGVTETTYELPASWLQEMVNVTSMGAECVLTTYVGGAAQVARRIPFTANVPEGYAPVIESFAVARYAEKIDDEGETIYVQDVSGNHVWVNAGLRIDRAGGVNPGTAYIVYYPADDPEDATRVNLSWPADELTLTDDRAIITGEIPTGGAYVFELHAGNGHSEIARQARVEKSWAMMHFAGTGYGIGIGMYSDGTQANPKLQIAWPMYDGAGNRIGGTDWDPGDTWTVPNDVLFPGEVTDTTRIVYATIFLGGRIRATQITLSGAVILRGPSGYLNNMSYQTGIAVGTSGYTFSAEIVSAKAGIVKIKIQKSSAYTNVSNNVPVVMSMVEDNPLTLTFA